MNRADLLTQLLDKKNIDAILLSDFSAVSWASGFSGDDSHILVTRDERLFFTDSRYTEQAGEEISDFTVIETGGADRMSAIGAHIKGVLGIEYQKTSLSDNILYNKHFDIENTCDISKDISALRAIKSDAEILRMREGAAITEWAFYELIKFIKAGVTERDIYAELVYRFNKKGAVPSFTPIIASGENSSKPHAGVTNRVVLAGDLITMDFGVKYKGVCTDFTRTIAISGIEKEKLLVYNTINSANKAALCALRSGISGSEADAAARHIINNAGYKEYFGHGTGHGVGVDIHEAPRLSPSSADTLEAGMVVTVEPGIYLPGRFGVRIEDMVLITKDGYENFYSADKELIII